MKSSSSNNSVRLSIKAVHLSNNHGQKVLEFFFENPSIQLTIRDLARKLKLSPSTLHIHLLNLRKEGLISKENQWVDNWYNRLLKSNYYLEKFAKCGLIDYLDQELAASSIIIFGSFRKGESNQESDIDLFVECGQNKRLNLSSFEKKLGHKIQLFTKPDINLLPKNLLNNVVNGIKIKGYFNLK